MIAQQWIPLTGPGGRLPTIEDASDWGCVLAANATAKDITAWQMAWEGPGKWTHWAPIPKAPPLPKPVELSQDEKDGIDYKRWALLVNRSIHGDGLAAFRKGKADGRAQLAREALGLFGSLHIPTVCLHLREQDWENLPVSIEHIHALLTKAAEETK